MWTSRICKRTAKYVPDQLLLSCAQQYATRAGCLSCKLTISSDDEGIHSPSSLSWRRPVFNCRFVVHTSQSSSPQPSEATPSGVSQGCLRMSNTSALLHIAFPSAVPVKVPHE